MQNERKYVFVTVDPQSLTDDEKTLDSDGQLKNISIDDNNNLIPNDAFKAYKDKVDDFYRFELNKFL